jgi:hypothetical protein
LDSFTDSLTAALQGTKSLKDAFTSMTDGIIADLLRIAIQQQIVRPLANSLFGTTGEDGATTGGLFSKIFGGAKGIVEGDDVVAKVLGKTGFPRLPGMATGGSMMVGGNAGIDRNVLSINGKPRALVSASERIDVSPANLRAANDRRPISVTIVADEGAAFVPRVAAVSRGVSIKTVRQANALAGRQSMQQL